MIRMFKPGDLISRYSKKGSAKGHCVVVDKDEDNYTLYNNSLKSLQKVACTAVDRLYMKVVVDREVENVYEMT